MSPSNTRRSTPETAPRSTARAGSVRSTSLPAGVPRCRSEMTSVRSALRRSHSLADRLGQHEPDVLLDDLELLHVAGPARPEELDQALDELLGCARTRGDPHHALVGEPLLAHLDLVVDQVRLRTFLARHLHEPV